MLFVIRYDVWKTVPFATGNAIFSFADKFLQSASTILHSDSDLSFFIAPTRSDNHENITGKRLPKGAVQTKRPRNLRLTPHRGGK